MRERGRERKGGREGEREGCHSCKRESVKIASERKRKVSKNEVKGPVKMREMKW